MPYRELIQRDLAHARLLTEAICAGAELELQTPVTLGAVRFHHCSRDNGFDPPA